MKDLSIFPKICNGSGALGYFNEDEYWYQVACRRIGFRYKKGLGFNSKTTTMDERAGHMPLTKDYKPVEWYPGCIVFDMFNGNGINSVAVPTPGFPTLLATGKWQQRTEPFFISIMSMAATQKLRLGEFRRIANVLSDELKHFKAPVGLELNLSCPNGEEDPRELIKDSAAVFRELRPLGVALVGKYSVASAPIPAMMELEKNPDCDGVCFSNTWHYYFEGFGQKVFGRKKSPLHHLGGGGVSGKQLRKKVLPYIRQLRVAGFTKHIRGGGGIFSVTHVRQYRDAGASSCFICSVIPMRIWLVPGIIRYANSLTWR